MGGGCVPEPLPQPPSSGSMQSLEACGGFPKATPGGGPGIPPGCSAQPAHCMVWDAVASLHAQDPLSQALPASPGPTSVPCPGQS